MDDYEEYEYDLERQIEAAEWHYEYLRDEGLLRNEPTIVAGLETKEKNVIHLGGE